MASSAALALLRANLGYPLSAVPDDVTALMTSDLDAAAADLTRMGIPADEADPSDLTLLVMYAAWRYRKRINGEPISPMLRAAINDRKVAKATQTPEA